MIYIYKITNKLNNKCYIGQTIDLQRRWRNHSTLNKSKISRAIFKYKIENFSFEIICKCKSQKQANKQETYFINYYDSFNTGYNSIPKAFGVQKGNIPWNKGKKIGPNLKLSKAKQGNIPWNKGKKVPSPSIETRRKLSIATKLARKKKFWSTKHV